MKMPDSPPCVIFGFDRPHYLKKVLRRLKVQGVDRLIVFIDGPRGVADEACVRECRALVENADWADKECYFKEKNEGLPALIENIDKVFERYDSAVFIEDDCLPMPSFYAFMKQALLKYQKEERVFSIGAYQPVSANFFRNYPYSVVGSPRFMCWGWGTWRKAWHNIRGSIDDYAGLFNNLTDIPDVAGQDLVRMAIACKSKPYVSWDIKVSVAMLWLEMIQVVPTVCLVKNMGIGTGTHKNTSMIKIWWRRWLQQRNLNKGKENFVWLNRIDSNDDYAIQHRKYVDFIHSPLRRQIRLFLGGEF